MMFLKFIRLQTVPETVQLCIAHEIYIYGSISVEIRWFLQQILEASAVILREPQAL